MSATLPIKIVSNGRAVGTPPQAANSCHGSWEQLTAWLAIMEIFPANMPRMAATNTCDTQAVRLIFNLVPHMTTNFVALHLGIAASNASVASALRRVRSEPFASSVTRGSRHVYCDAAVV